MISNIFKPYPKYIPTDVEWLGEIPENWKTTKVVELMKLGRGRVISQEDIRNNEGEFPVYSSQTENEGILGYIETYDFEGEYITWTTDGANTGTVFSRSGKFNCTNVCGTMTQKYNIYKEITYLPFLAKFLNIASKRYVRYDLNPKLMNNEMSRIELLLPPLPEQQAIVAFLDCETERINTIIAKQNQLIELLKEKRTALIIQAVTKGLNRTAKMKSSSVDWIGDIPNGWDFYKVMWVFNNIGSGNTPTSSDARYYDENGFSWVLTGDLNDNSVQKTTKHITQKAIEDNPSLKKFPIGSLIIAMYGATIGKLGLLSIEAYTNQACCVLTNSNFLLTKFAYYWFLGLRKHIINLSDGGGQPNISQKVIKQIQICVPPLTEQKSIIDYLDRETEKIDALITKIEKQINLLKEYKLSLISHAVTGKFDVRGEGYA